MTLSNAPFDLPKRQRPRGPRRCIYAAVRLPLELVEELRDLVVFKAHRGVRTTMAATVEAGLNGQRHCWRNRLNDGRRFRREVASGRASALWRGHPTTGRGGQRAVGDPGTQARIGS